MKDEIMGIKGRIYLLLAFINLQCGLLSFEACIVCMVCEESLASVIPESVVMQ